MRRYMTRADLDRKSLAADVAMRRLNRSLARTRIPGTASFLAGWRLVGEAVRWVWRRATARRGGPGSSEPPRTVR